MFSGPPGVGKSETMRWIIDRGSQEFQQTYYQLGYSELRRMLADGVPISSESTIILIDDIDADLLRDRKETKNRPGRLDHVVTFDYPTPALAEEFCDARGAPLNSDLFQGWSFARIDMFLAKAKAAKFLHGTSPQAYFEKFVHDMGERDKTVEAFQVEDECEL